MVYSENINSRIIDDCVNDSIITFNKFSCVVFVNFKNYFARVNLNTKNFCSLFYSDNLKFCISLGIFGNIFRNVF